MMEMSVIGSLGMRLATCTLDVCTDFSAFSSMGLAGWVSFLASRQTLEGVEPQVDAPLIVKQTLTRTLGVESSASS